MYNSDCGVWVRAPSSGRAELGPSAAMDPCMFEILGYLCAVMSQQGEMVADGGGGQARIVKASEFPHRVRVNAVTVASSDQGAPVHDAARPMNDE